jgi:hypothetical protein
MTNTINRHTVLYDGGPGTGQWFRIDAKYTDGDSRGVQGTVGGGGTVTIEGTTRENLGGPAFGQNILGDNSLLTPAPWIYGPNWTFNNDGSVSSDGSQTSIANLTQENLNIQAGYTYTLNYTISNYVAGTITPFLSGTAGTIRSANGSYSETIIAGSTFPRLQLSADAAFVGDISNAELILEVPASDIGTLQTYNTDFTDVLNSSWSYIRVTLDVGTAKVQGLI